MQPLTPIQSPVQSKVLSGLLAGQPIAAVARESGIDRSTIYHWRKDTRILRSPWAKPAPASSTTKT